MRVIVEGVSGPGKGRTFTLRSGDVFLVGRTEWSDIAVGGDQQMSAKHFSVEFTGDSARLVDQNSTNGTQVNGKFIKEAPLQDGDQIVAGTTTFRVRIDEGAHLAGSPLPAGEGESAPPVGPRPVPPPVGSPSFGAGVFGGPQAGLGGESPEPRGGTPFGSLEIDPDQLSGGHTEPGMTPHMPLAGGAGSSSPMTPPPLASGAGSAGDAGPGGGHAEIPHPIATPESPATPFEDGGPLAGEGGPTFPDQSTPLGGNPFDESPFQGSPAIPPTPSPPKAPPSDSSPTPPAPPRPASAAPYAPQPSSDLDRERPAPPPTTPPATPPTAPPTAPPTTASPFEIEPSSATDSAPATPLTDEPAAEVGKPASLSESEAQQTAHPAPAAVYDHRHSAAPAAPQLFQFTQIPTKSPRVVLARCNYQGVEVECHPSALLALFERQLSTLAMAHFAKAGVDFPEGLSEARPILYWLPEESAREFGPVLIPPTEQFDLLSTFDELWDQNAVLAIFSRDIEGAIEHIRDLVKRNPQTMEREQEGMFAFFYPVVLESLIRSQEQDLLERLFGDVIEGFLMEVAEAPGQWQLAGTPEFLQLATQLGLREIPAEEESA